MHRFMPAIRICGIQFRKNLFTQRTCVVFVLIGLYLFLLMQPVREMAEDVGYNATPVALVFLSCDSIVQMVLMAGSVALFSNAPFKDETQPYLIVRSGKCAWILGNGLYLIGMSVIYMLFVLLMSIVPLLPNVDFSPAWGKVWGTLAETDAGSQYQVLFSISSLIKRSYQPGTALLHALFSEIGCTAFLGACIYFGNSLSEKPIGLWFGAGLVFFDIMVYNLFPGSWLRYSPLSMSMIGNQMRSKWGITFSYVMIFFSAGFALLIAVCGLRDKLLWRKVGEREWNSQS